jgi:hypothetical protein
MRLRVAVAVCGLVGVLIGSWVAVRAGALTGAEGRAQAGQSAHAEALAAALGIFNGVPLEECLADPRQRACIEPRSSPEEAERGIAVFGVTFAAASPLVAVLGRDRDGAWAYWFGTVGFVYQLLRLPGEMKVCAAPDGLDLRAGPSPGAAVVGRLAHLTAVRAEELLLTEPGVARGTDVLERNGAGWYRLSAPLAGWAPATSLTNTEVDATLRLPDCATRDALVESGP